MATNPEVMRQSQHRKAESTIRLILYPRRGELYSRALRKDKALLAISPNPFFLAAFSKLNDSARAATDCPALFLNSAMASRVSNSSSKS